ncbi:2-oxoglutarate-dependent dioxygenase AOP2 [Ziziphus jujuba]|uniref:2-oxoglutarate-dependent dioxygenase AOP2 n=1 Tax=Ziziphus jujuba TaxID=326968 RepID=A0A6P4A0U0_ZIZJJ|nr:2-oxoglutarate-dependent dioxygenase AOP2 [Ziziphus jujuba]
MCNQVRCALEEHGCFLAKYDQLSPQLSAKVLSQTKDMFELPIEIKLRNTVDLPNRGYAIDKFQKMPLHEGMGIDNARFVEETQKFMNLMWPDGKDNFCYGTGKHYASFAASNSHVIRFLKFIPQEDPEVTNIRLQPHKDLSFATIVHQVDVGGLEVEANDGSWIALQPEPSHFVFMACQAMQGWSNDRIKACKQRVTVSGNEGRHSLALFNFNNGVIQVPEEMVDDEHPLLYNSFDHNEYIHFFIRSFKSSKDALKLQFENPLKAFCGV